MPFYIDKHAQSSLKAYEYSGTDLSLTYKYLLSPWAQFCVDHFTPLTMAPNTITFIGLLGMLASYLVMWYYCPNLDEAVDSDSSPPSDNDSIPRWIFLFNGVMMFFYQTLDNMDGKQARRTENGTPLGMLFDHGCDAINSPLGSACWACAMGIGPSSRVVMFATLTSSMIPFYTATWEEYYTGALVLPVINGPNEGILMGAALSVASFLWGASYWHTYSWNEAWLGKGIDFVVSMCPAQLAAVVPELGFKNYEILVGLGLGCAMQELILKSVSVVKSHGLLTLVNQLPFVVLLGASVKLFSTEMGERLLLQVPRTAMLLFGVLFVEMVCALMLDHMCKKSFNPIRPILVPLVAMVVMVSYQLIEYEVLVSAFQMYFSGAFVFLSFRLFVAGSEICEALNIWCFDIVNKRKKEKLA